MVLAAGLGTRLLPLTRDRAKPSLSFVGKPILSWVLDGLADAGVTDAVVNLHHAPRSILDVLRSRGDAPPRVTTSDETAEVLGTGGALVPVRATFRDGGDFFVVNGDCVHAIDYGALLRAHEASGASATLAVRGRGEPGFRSLLCSPDDEVTDFGVPTRGTPDERHYLSVQVVAPRLLDALPTDRRVFGSLSDWYPLARRAGHRIRVLETEAEWHGVDSRELYLRATRDWLAARGRDAFIAPGADVHPTARVLEGSAVHAGCRVGAGAVLRGTALLEACVVGEAAELRGCLVGPGSCVPAGTRLLDETVVAP
jgi:NDP-sugar pyrophosphorylase family protein